MPTAEANRGYFNLNEKRGPEVRENVITSSNARIVSRSMIMTHSHEVGCDEADRFNGMGIVVGKLFSNYGYYSRV
jgi:hypothetical protein